MAQQALPYGQSDNDPNPANSLPIREAWKRTGEMFSDLYSSLTTITDAGAFEFSGELTDEEKIDAAIASALASGDTIVRIPFGFLPYDVTLLTNLAAFTAAGGRLVREGGDYTVNDVRAYGGVGGGHIYDIPSIQAAVNGAAVSGALVFIPSDFAIAQGALAGITGLFTGENAGGVRLLSGHNPTLANHGNSNYVPGDDTAWGQLHVYSQIMAVGAPTAGGADLTLMACKHRSGGVDYDVHIVGQKVNGVLSTGVLFIDMDIKVSEFYEAPFRGHGLRITQGDNSPVMEFPISGGVILMPGKLKGQNGANLNTVLRIGGASGSLFVENDTGASNLLTLSNAGAFSVTGSVQGVGVASTTRTQHAVVGLTSGASVALNAAAGNQFRLNITTDVAAVIQVPTNAPASGFTQTIWIEIVNGSGGALSTAPTFATGAGGFLFSAVTNPANGLEVVYQFVWNSSRARWVEVGTHQATGI